MNFLLFIVIAAAIPHVILYLRRLHRMIVYKRSDYYTATRKRFRTVRRDLGLWGEYLTYLKLRKLPGDKKFLYNCYVPKGDGTFTEIDLIMLHASGVYVFESKNYSGWIFGSEADQYWTQSLRGGRKERFYNPIKQNNAHIRQLMQFIPNLTRESTHSVIVFSERCELRKLSYSTEQQMIVKRNHLNRTMKLHLQRQLSSPIDIDAIYQKLYPQTQLTEQQKQAHIQRVTEIKQKPPSHHRR